MTEDLEGLCAYTDGSKLRLAYVLNLEKKRARALISSGREILLPLKNFVFSFSRKVSENDFINTCLQIEQEIELIAKSIDLPILWEMLSEEGKDKFTFEEICKSYFADVGDIEQAALFDKICGDVVYFKRRGLDFTIRDEEQVQAILRSQEKKREKEAYEAELEPWVQSVIDAPKGLKLEVPDKFSSFTGQLCNLIWHKKSSEASRFLDRLIGKSPLRLKAVEFLKKTGNIPVELDEHLVMAGIHPGFSQKLNDCAEKITFSSSVNRKEFSDEFLCFSIDDDSTQDVDDVLSIEYLENGYRIGVHIADVAAYIQKGSELDEEALRRASSIYLPTGNVNMFPASLATGKFSLLPCGERPAVSYYIDLNNDLDINAFKIERSLIKVTHKLSYSFCDNILEGAECEDQKLKSAIENLYEISKKLCHEREEKGAFSFNRPEYKITINDGLVDLSEVRASSLSRALVGEFMILANSQAAAYCRDQEIPILYRVQEKSDNPLSIPKEYNPVEFDKAVKCLKKSKMTLYASGHAGLGVECYTQFTSPIRRYTDLVMQRQLVASIEGRDFDYNEEELTEILTRVESTLGEIREVQRQSENFWLLSFLQQKKIAELYNATVISRINGGLMVELDGLALRLKLNHGEKLVVGTRLKVKIIDVQPKLGQVKLSFECLLEE